MTENCSACLVAGLVLLTTTLLYLARKFFAGGVCKITKDLTGQIVVITGANTGIGKETARTLAQMNATIILACRDAKRTVPVVEELKKETNNSKIEYMQLDLSSLASIKAFADEFKKKHQNLHILINNAGVMSIPNRAVTKDGFEMQFGTNHLGHFYLTKLLLDVVEKSTPSRIINLSSMGHYFCRKINWDDIMYERNYNPDLVYVQSKLANVLFTKKLQEQERLKGKDVTVVSLHPGAVRTELMRNMKDKWYLNILIFLMQPIIHLTFKSASQGAQTTLYCALEDSKKLQGGSYYSDCKAKKENSLAADQGNADRLWTLSEELIATALKKVN